NTGTIPSKTLREAAVYLTGLSERGLYGQSYRVKEEITIDDLIWRTQQVMSREIDVIRNQLARNHVHVLIGAGRLADAHRVEVSDERGGVRTVETDRIQGATAGLGLEEVGIEIDKRGRIAVDEHYRTAVDHIYAVGDVIGFPSLASSSFEQGRLAAAHAFGLETRPMRELLPIGIYTIPE